jgi:hydroxyacyl-ACP dehydratase HTD2-like protein with hotdog domain
MLRIETINVGDLLPERKFKPDNVQLFLYDAALWNAHRIHFDYPYATGVEGYSGLVIAGPLMGDWLSQCVVDWAGDDGKLASIEYSNRKAAFVGEVLSTGGKVLSVDSGTCAAELEVFVKNEANEVIIPGTAVVSF